MLSESYRALRESRGISLSPLSCCFRLQLRLENATSHTLTQRRIAHLELGSLPSLPRLMAQSLSQPQVSHAWDDWATNSSCKRRDCACRGVFITSEGQPRSLCRICSDYHESLEQCHRSSQPTILTLPGDSEIVLARHKHCSTLNS